jgi:hypothetical protein
MLCEARKSVKADCLQQRMSKWLTSGNGIVGLTARECGCSMPSWTCAGFSDLGDEVYHGGTYIMAILRA